MLRNAVCRRTARKPPGPSTSNLNGAATALRDYSWVAVAFASHTTGALATKSRERGGLGDASMAESVVDRFPLAEGERLRPSLRIDAQRAQACRCIRAAESTEAAQRATELLPAELKHRLDQAEEIIQVADLHGRLPAHLKQDQGRVDSRWRGEGRRWDGERHPGLGEDLDRDRGQARTSGRRPTLPYFLLHHERQA